MTSWCKPQINLQATFSEKLPEFSPESPDSESSSPDSESENAYEVSTRLSPRLDET